MGSAWGLGRFDHLYQGAPLTEEKDGVWGFEPPAAPGADDLGTWENFESPQDVCATAYWYQTLPSPHWPALEPYAGRVGDLGLPTATPMP